MITDPLFYAAAVQAVILMGLAKGGFSGLGLLYLPPDLCAPGTALEVEVFGERVAAEVAADVLYDPAGARIRA